MWKRASVQFEWLLTAVIQQQANVSYNLGAVPEMMWVKRRDNGTSNWAVYHSCIRKYKAISFKLNKCRSNC